MVFIHGCTGAHSIEQLIFLPVLGDDVSSTLVMAGKHTAKHHKVSPRTKRLGNVTRASTTTILEGANGYASKFNSILKITSDR